MTNQSIHFQDIQHVAAPLGLELVGISHRLSIDSESEKRLKEWQDSGHAGDLEYMKYPAERYLDLQHFLPEARSAVSFMVYYDRSESPKRPDGYGRIARYAWGRDYHRILKKRLQKFQAAIESKLDRPVRARSFSDAVPLLERRLAHEAGLGFVGKNTMLIKKKSGSYMFLCEVIWELEVEGAKGNEVQESSCGACVRCLVNCPTGAIVKPYVIDAPKCISYLSIEKKGVLSEWESSALGEWVFGCDICQEVCPFNHSVLKNPDSAPQEFERSSGQGPLLNLSEVLHLRSDVDFLKRFAGTPLMRPKREGILRNAACVAANTGARDVIPALYDAYKNDSSEVIRHHAGQALDMLGS